ncbi:MAG: LacI family DNA-binding transcriptional regulator, partial [Spirochaetia bacterium]|nr:LacI family DNA-binding transcriptional regulator [Spirochaetia bacterium]HOH16971.1 LacI family DNA-binding transcriptional regulator [Rectinema sp.]
MSKATVTIRHVAERAKVSTATVSRVLNNNPCVRQRTRQTVLEAIDSLGYKLNVVARSLKTSRT